MDVRQFLPLQSKLELAGGKSSTLAVTAGIMQPCMLAGLTVNWSGVQLRLVHGYDLPASDTTFFLLTQVNWNAGLEGSYPDASVCKQQN